MEEEEHLKVRGWDVSENGSVAPRTSACFREMNVFNDLFSSGFNSIVISILSMTRCGGSVMFFDSTSNACCLRCRARNSTSWSKEHALWSPMTLMSSGELNKTRAQHLSSQHRYSFAKPLTPTREKR